MDKNAFSECHIEYLCEQYEKLSSMATNEVPITKDKAMVMRKAFRSYDKDGNGVLDRDEIFDLLKSHYKE